MTGPGRVDLATVDLDPYRLVGDPLADRAVADYFAAVETLEPGALFGDLVRHVALPDHLARVG